MRPLATLFVALLFVASGAAAEDYGWSVSSSSTNPYVHSGAFGGTPGPLYLWLTCTAVDGVSALEADLLLGGGWFFAGYVPVAPSNNFGSGNALQLGVGGCPFAGTGTEVLIGILNMFALAPGSVCLVPSAANGLNITVDCQPVPGQFPNAIAGFANDGTTPCVVGSCGGVAVEPSTWGGVKGLYR